MRYIDIPRESISLLWKVELSDSALPDWGDTFPLREVAETANAESGMQDNGLSEVKVVHTGLVSWEEAVAAEEKSIAEVKRTEKI